MFKEPCESQGEKGNSSARYSSLAKLASRKKEGFAGDVTIVISKVLMFIFSNQRLRSLLEDRALARGWYYLWKILYMSHRNII